MSKKKTKIVIASVLKPVDDVRNFEKLARSLAKERQYEVSVMGVASVQLNTESVISQMPWPDFSRLSVGRLLIQWRYIRRLFKVRPDLIIVTTHELLVMSVLYSFISKTKLVYDVQEDYYRNLRYQQFYPLFLRLPLALLIRLTEKACAPFIQHFILAEATYASDISFVKRCCTVIDNKALPIEKMPSSGPFKIVFTGTISSYSEAVESVQLFKKIRTVFSISALTVIGYCPNPSYRKVLEQQASNTILLKVSDRPVPHALIVHEIATANLAIIGYSPNQVNKQKVPTKQYEYTAAQVPYIVRKDTHWSALGQTMGGAIPIDFDDPNPSEIRKKYDKIKGELIRKEAAHWSNNEGRLQEIIRAVLN